MEYPKLNRPPVLEAIIGISIAENEYWMEYYKAVVELIKSEYAIVNERVSFRVKGKITPSDGNYENLADTQVIKDGYTLSNPDTRKTVLLKPDSIQIIKKAPYIEWDDLFLDFKKVLSALNQVAPVLQYFKPYLRYRNGFSMNISDNESMSEHFNIVHSIPSLLTEFAIGSMAFSVDMMENNLNYKIEQKLKPSEKKTSSIDVIINIDVVENIFKTVAVDEVLNVIQYLRDKKNQIFFSLITEKTKQNFF